MGLEIKADKTKMKLSRWSFCLRGITRDVLATNVIFSHLKQFWAKLYVYKHGK